jgi:hypothetical protein
VKGPHGLSNVRRGWLVVGAVSILLVAAGLAGLALAGRSSSPSPTSRIQKYVAGGLEGGTQKWVTVTVGSIDYVQPAAPGPGIHVTSCVKAGQPQGTILQPYLCQWAYDSPSASRHFSPESADELAAREATGGRGWVYGSESIQSRSASMWNGTCFGVIPWKQYTSLHLAYPNYPASLGVSGSIRPC